MRALTAVEVVGEGETRALTAVEVGGEGRDLQRCQNGSEVSVLRDFLTPSLWVFLTPSLLFILIRHRI